MKSDLHDSTETKNFSIRFRLNGNTFSNIESQLGFIHFFTLIKSSVTRWLEYMAVYRNENFSNNITEVWL